jgi:hypothetical protein
LSERPSKRRVSDRDVLDTYFARRVPGGALSRRFADAFFSDPSSRSALLEDAVATDSLGSALTFLTRNVQRSIEPIDAMRRISLSLELAWRKSRSVFVEDAEFLAVAMLKELKLEEAREVLRYLASEEEAIVLGEAVLRHIFREMDYWSDGKIIPNVGRGRRSWKGIIDEPQADELRRSWFRTISKLNVEDFVEKRPNFMSVLFRWGQFDPDPYEEVRERMGQYLRSPQAALAFVSGFAPRDGVGRGIEGVEQLVPNIREFLYFLRRSAPPQWVADKFAERFGEAWGIEHDPNDPDSPAPSS